MFKFITNISCVLNLAVIIMLTSSQPTSITSSANVSTNTNTSKILDEYISTLKMKYPKLNSFDQSFLNSSDKNQFLNGCSVKDMVCMTYFDMLLRLADSLTDDSLKSISQELLINQVSGESFCAEFIAAIPEVPFSTYTNISIQMKDTTMCHIKCLLLNETKIIVRPICGITLSGYKHITANSKPSINSSTPDNTVISTIIQASNAPSGVIASVGSSVNVAQSKDAALQNIETHEPISTLNNEAPLPKVSSNAKPIAAKHSVPIVPNPLPNGVVSPPVQENLAMSSIKPAAVSDVKTDNIEDNKNNDNMKVEVSDIKIDQPINTKTDTQKKDDNVAPSGEMNPSVNAPPIDAATPSESSFISNGKVFDGELMNVPGENDEAPEDYNDDEEGQNQDDEVHAREKSGEAAVVKSNDMLEEQKQAPQVDAAYGKYTKQEENNEQLDPFTEDTDSNFFTYFMFIMVLCIMLYVVYHNKTKVLALVLEGRRGSHSGRGIGRRKHTAAYRKLDSNLEEAITSNASGRTTQIIY